MRVVKTIDEVRTQVKEWRAQGLTVGLVPTMGYLHEGHASLIDASHRDNDRTVVSDFVNPMQFGPTEDLESYPRDIDRDAKLVEEHGGDIIFNPEPSEMYHEGFSSFVDMTVLTQELCGLSRPVHFRGVCTVVNKLFNILTVYYISKYRMYPQLFKIMKKIYTAAVQSPSGYDLVSAFTQSKQCTGYR